MEKVWLPIKVAFCEELGQWVVIDGRDDIHGFCLTEKAAVTLKLKLEGLHEESVEHGQKAPR